MDLGKFIPWFIQEALLGLLKGLHLLFLPNVPGATFIQGATLIVTPSLL